MKRSINRAVEFMHLEGMVISRVPRIVGKTCSGAFVEEGFHLLIGDPNLAPGWRLGFRARGLRVEGFNGTGCHRFSRGSYFPNVRASLFYCAGTSEFCWCDQGVSFSWLERLISAGGAGESGSEVCTHGLEHGS